MKSLSSYELRQVAGGKLEMTAEALLAGGLTGGLTVVASAALSVGSVFAPGLIVMAMGATGVYTGALSSLTPLLDAGVSAIDAQFNQTFA